MISTGTLPLTEALLDLLLRRYREAGTASPSAPGTVAVVLVGPHSGGSAGLPTPRLTVTFGETRRGLVGIDGQVANRFLLELALDDAVIGDESAMRLSLRWAAWIESVLIPEAEQTGPHLDALVESLEPVDAVFEAGGPGLGEFTLKLRFLLTASTLLGNPYL